MDTLKNNHQKNYSDEYFSKISKLTPDVINSVINLEHVKEELSTHYTILRFINVVVAQKLQYANPGMFYATLNNSEINWWKRCTLQVNSPDVFSQHYAILQLTLLFYTLAKYSIGHLEFNLDKTTKCFCNCLENEIQMRNNNLNIKQMTNERCKYELF